MPCKIGWPGWLGQKSRSAFSSWSIEEKLSGWGTRVRLAQQAMSWAERASFWMTRPCARGQFLVLIKKSFFLAAVKGMTYAVKSRSGRIMGGHGANTHFRTLEPFPPWPNTKPDTTPIEIEIRSICSGRTGTNYRICWQVAIGYSSLFRSGSIDP